MIIGMTRPKTKLAVSLDATLVDRVKALVASGTAPSVSAYVEHALTSQLAAEADFDASVAEGLRKTGGPLKPAERSAARRLLRGVA